MSRQRSRAIRKLGRDLVQEIAKAVSADTAASINAFPMILKFTSVRDGGVGALEEALQSRDDLGRLTAAQLILQQSKNSHLDESTAHESAVQVFRDYLGSSITTHRAIACSMLRVAHVATIFLPQLRQLRYDDDREVRFFATAALIHSGDILPDAVREMQKALSSPLDWMVLTAAHCLGSRGIHQPQVAQALQHLFDSSTERFQECILLTISQLGSLVAGMASWLAKLCQSDKYSITLRCVALMALGRVSAQSAKPPTILVGLLDSKLSRLAKASLLALGSGRGVTPSLIAKLATLICSDDSEVRELAAWVLSTRAAHAGSVLTSLLDRLALEQHYPVIQHLVETVAGIGGQAIPTLIRLVKECPASQLELATLCLAKIGMPAIVALVTELEHEVVPRLEIVIEATVKRLENGCDAVVDFIADKLLHCDSEEVAIALAQCLSVSSIITRRGVAAILCWLERGIEECRAALTPALTLAVRTGLLTDLDVNSLTSDGAQQLLRQVTAAEDQSPVDPWLHYRVYRSQWTLWVVREVANLIEERPALSTMGVATAFAAINDEHSERRQLPATKRGIEQQIKRFETDFALRIRTSSQGRAGPLSEAGKEHLRDLRAYFEQSGPPGRPSHRGR